MGSPEYLSFLEDLSLGLNHTSHSSSSSLKSSYAQPVTQPCSEYLHMGSHWLANPISRCSGSTPVASLQGIGFCKTSRSLGQVVNQGPLRNKRASYERLCSLWPSAQVELVPSKYWEPDVSFRSARTTGWLDATVPLQGCDCRRSRRLEISVVLNKQRLKQAAIPGGLQEQTLRRTEQPTPRLSPTAQGDEKKPRTTKNKPFYESYALEMVKLLADAGRIRQSRDCNPSAADTRATAILRSVDFAKPCGASLMSSKHRHVPWSTAFLKHSVSP